MKHVVSVSGGKDSTATYCRALERLGPDGFRAVAADTGNEHPATYDAVNNLSRITGGPVVEWVRADFTGRIKHRRDYIAAKWPLPAPSKGFPLGVPDDIIRRALAVLDDRLAHPEQANPYLDLCLWKGRFPSRKAQFCTVELKVEPINHLITKPLLATGETVVSWQGVRAAESFERSLLPPLQKMDAEFILGAPTLGKFYVWRPLLRVATVEEVFAIAARHGLAPNPLYGWGCSRVGCFPCINAQKGEIALVDAFFPEQVDRLELWEAIVKEVSKRGVASFFPGVNDPVMAMEFAIHAHLFGPLDRAFYEAGDYGVRRMVEWAKTDRGGRQYNLFFQPEGTTCATHGACE